MRFAYPDGPEVLHGIDLDFPARTSVAVVGATGSGKTTIAKLVTRLMDPTAGAVRLDGVDLRDVSAASLRERVVLVPQEGFLFDGTLAENIAYGVRDARGNPGAGAGRRPPRSPLETRSASTPRSPSSA
ncbi:ATP-binding cassette domain-containing protein [Oerskovia sp. M15]